MDVLVVGVGSSNRSNLDIYFFTAFEEALISREERNVIL